MSRPQSEGKKKKKGNDIFPGSGERARPPLFLATKSDWIGLATHEQYTLTCANLEKKLIQLYSLF